MTADLSMALAELAEKGADTDALRQMLAFVAQRLMEFDVEGRCGAGYGERSEGREVARNGYRESALGDARRSDRPQDPAPSSGEAAISRRSSSRAGPPKRRSSR